MIGPSFPPARPAVAAYAGLGQPTKCETFHSTGTKLSSKLFTQARSPLSIAAAVLNFPKQTGSLDYSFLLTQLRLCSQAQEECQASVTNADERVLGACATQ
jgi:hypothetical protein